MIGRRHPADCGRCSNRTLCPVCSPVRTPDQVLAERRMPPARFTPVMIEGGYGYALGYPVGQLVGSTLP